MRGAFPSGGGLRDGCSTGDVVCERGAGSVSRSASLSVSGSVTGSPSVGVG